MEQAIPRVESLRISITGMTVPHQISMLVITSEYLGLTHIPECSGCLTLGGPGPAPQLSAGMHLCRN